MKTTPLTKDNIIKLRQKFHRQIKTYAEKRYDARPLLDSYFELNRLLEEMGCNPNPQAQYLSREYWGDPSNYDNQSKNTNPIVRCEGFEMIRTTPINTTQHKYSKPFPKQSSNVGKKEYYRINITWLESQGIESDSANKLKQFFKDMGIKESKSIIKKVRGSICHSIDYELESTAEGFKMLLRSATVMLDIVSNYSFKILITGEKLT